MFTKDERWRRLEAAELQVRRDLSSYGSYNKLVGSDSFLMAAHTLLQALKVAPDGGYRVAGDKFLIERYETAKAVPPERRSYDVVTFVHTYELLGDVVHTLPWIEVM